MKNKSSPPTDLEQGDWDESSISRRNFLQLGVLTTAGIGSLAVGGTASRFLVGDALKVEEGTWVELGKVDGFPTGEVHKVAFRYRTTDAWRQVERSGALYTFSDNGDHYLALDATCTHLGCLVRWKQEHNHFACPCHEGIFSKEGELLGGAPSKPLRKLETKVENGLLFALI